VQHAVIRDLGLDHLGILVVILVQDLALIHHKEVVEDLEEDMEVAEELDLPEAVEVIAVLLCQIENGMLEVVMHQKLQIALEFLD